eukprot:gene1060-630_t
MVQPDGLALRSFLLFPLNDYVTTTTPPAKEKYVWKEEKPTKRVKILSKNNSLWMFTTS